MLQTTSNQNQNANPDIPIHASRMEKQELRFDVPFGSDDMEGTAKIVLLTETQGDDNVDPCRMKEEVTSRLKNIGMNNLFSTVQQLTNSMFASIDATNCKVSVSGMHAGIQFSLTCQKKKPNKRKQASASEDS